MSSNTKPDIQSWRLRLKAIRHACGGIALFFGVVGSASAGTLTVQTDTPRPTPEISGYNLGHFYPGSNTRDWWRYSGVSGARIFISPSQIESASVVAAAAGLVGVSNETSFLACRAAMHTNQFNPDYIPWPTITNNYNNNDLYPVNHIIVSPALAALRSLGIEVCAQITASQNTFPIADANDWADLWGLWHHYYAQAFYLGRYYDVQRYQIYNEPNASGGPAVTNFLLRAQFAADAISNALADVNRLYGKALAPMVLAPVLAGGATGHYPDWGSPVVDARHVNFLGVTDTNYWLFQKYDYHEYDSSPGGFGSHLASLNSSLQSDMAPDAPFAATISEFNTHTAANFDAIAATPDSPAEYADFGAILVNLLANGINELYCFKFSQVTYAGAYPVQKNAMYYVDNTHSPYNVGGITKGGEVFRLFNKAFAPGRIRLSVLKDAGASGLAARAAYNPVTQCYYLFSANNNASAVNLNLDLSALNLPANNRVLLEEVSETSYGGGVLWTNLANGAIVTATQPANSVWLLTVPSLPQLPEQIVMATADAEVRDGANKGNNYGSATTMTARNDPADSANRCAAFMKFHLPVTGVNHIGFAALAVQAACATSNCTAQAHVYFLPTTNWSPSTITWSTAPNLKQNSAPGSNIINSVILGVGTNASMVGQLVVTSTNPSEKLIDLTDFLRGQTNTDFSLLVVQDPRWDVTLPSLTPGDVQPGGVRITTLEGGAGPRLRLVISGTNVPAAVNDAYSGDENTALAVSAPGVLTNDAFATGAELLSGPMHGSLAFNSDGSFLYQPAANYFGADSFTYAATNDLGASPAKVSLAVNLLSPVSFMTNVPVTTEAFVRGGAAADADQDEAGAGYIMVKYYAPPFDSARKAYFQFDLTGLNVNTSTSAVFTINFLNNYQQNVQLWSLNQAYPDFTSGVTWNRAQANDTNSDDLLTAGAFTATPIGSFTNLPSSGTAPQSFTLFPLGNYIQSNLVTLALSGVTNTGSYLNNAGGLRVLRTNAVLRVQVAAAPATPPPQIVSITAGPNGNLVMNFSGATNRPFRVLATTNLAGGNWASVSTNFSDGSGTWSYTNFDVTNFPQRFYRAVTP